MIQKFNQCLHDNHNSENGGVVANRLPAAVAGDIQRLCVSEWGYTYIYILYIYILSSSIKAVSAVNSRTIGEQDHTKIILMFLFSFGCMKFSDVKRSRREAQLRASTQYQGVEVEVSIFHTSLFVKICSGLSIAVTCRTLWRFLFPSFMFGDVGPRWDTFGIPKYFNAFLESTSFLERRMMLRMAFAGPAWSRAFFAALRQ